MVSEKYISKFDDHLWQECAPTLTKNSKKYLKLIISKYANKKTFANVFIPKAPSYFNDLVSEIAFAHCAKIHNSKSLINKSITENAIERINLISGKKLTLAHLSLKELRDALNLSKRISVFLNDVKASDTVFHPRLRGYGYLNSCHPDLITKNFLIEIKASDYAFRLEDFRQIFLYYFLAVHNKIPIKTLVLVNPRFGKALFFDAVEYFELMTQMSSLLAFRKISQVLVSNYEI
jgi:hypothetical protein